MEFELQPRRIYDGVDDFRICYWHGARRCYLNRLHGTDQGPRGHRGEISRYKEDRARTPSMRADGPDPPQDGNSLRVVEQLGDIGCLDETAARGVETDHQRGVAAGPGFIDRLGQVVHGGSANRSVHDRKEDPRPLGPASRRNGGKDDSREDNDHDDACRPSAHGDHSCFSPPFFANAAVREATSPVMSPAAVVFVTTIMFFSRAISVRVCSSRSRIADGAEPYSIAASRIFSAAWASPSAMMTRERRSRSASACFAIARTIVSGRETSLKVTAETLIPHGSVAMSSSTWIRLLNSSRFDSNSSSATTRRSISTRRSKIGMIHVRPGPLGLWSSRPRRYTTSRSYSRTTLIADRRTTSTRMIASTVARMSSSPAMPPRSRRTTRAPRIKGLAGKAPRTRRNGPVG